MQVNGHSRIELLIEAAQQMSDPWVSQVCSSAVEASIQKVHLSQVLPREYSIQLRRQPQALT